MGDCLVVLPAVDSERCGIQPFVHGLRRGFARLRLTLTDVQIEPHALVQLLFFRILPEDRLEKAGCAFVVMALESFEAAFVERDRLEIGRTPLRSRWSWRRWRRRGRLRRRIVGAGRPCWG